MSKSWRNDARDGKYEGIHGQRNEKIGRSFQNKALRKTFQYEAINYEFIILVRNTSLINR